MVSGKFVSVSMIFANYAGADTTEAATLCELPIDLVVLQDTTGSFVESLPIVAAQIPSIVSAVKAAHPGSRFGAVEFKDKPYRDLGEPDDYCYRIAATITSDEEEFQDGYSQLYASGGGDVPEATLQALISTVLSSEIGWRPLSDADSAALRARASGDETEISGAHLIVLSTDATPHDPGDYQFYNGVYDGFYADEPYPPTVMPDFPDTPADYTADDLCTVYDYPSMAQAAQVVKASGAYVVFLVPEDEEDAVEHWKTFNSEYLGQPDAFVRYIKHDSSDIARLVIDVADEFAQYICSQSTSTSSTSTEADTTTVQTTLTTTIVDYTTTDSAGTVVSGSTAPVTSDGTVSGSTAPVTSDGTVSGSTAPVTSAPVTSAPVSGTTTGEVQTTATGTGTEVTEITTTGEVQTTATGTGTEVTEITTPFTSTVPSTSSVSTGTTDTVRTRPETQPDEPDTPTNAETTSVSDGADCQCDDGAGCGCPAVVIKIQDRPKSMHLDVEN